MDTPKFKLNSSCLNYLLDVYTMSISELYSFLNADFKKPRYSLDYLKILLKENSLITMQFLKKLNKIFEKGLT